MRDTIREQVIKAAEYRKLTSYAIAKATGGAVSEDQVRAYLTRKKSMTTEKLSSVLAVLGLSINGGRPKKAK